MTRMQPASPLEPVKVLNPEGRSSVVLVCEHASCFIPTEFGDLGLDDAARQSHIAWDPGALDVARGLAKHFDAKLVTSNVSRLIYDCNRPPSARDSMPARSDGIEIPANANLTDAQRQNRIATYYEPFRGALAGAIAATPDPVVVTMHSFTPVFNGTPRSIKIGILHDTDARLADAMMQVARSQTSENVKINAPYGPDDGVTHTLREHAIAAGHLNVMLEIRNDLIETSVQQNAMVACLTGWLSDALTILDVSIGVRC